VSARSRSIHARRGGSGLRGMPAVSTKSEMKERADFLIGYLIGVESLYPHVRVAPLRFKPQVVRCSCE
jgi:hypothetical protein